MIDLVKHRYWFFLLSIIVIIPGIISLILWGLNLGVDFTGGTVWQIQFNKPVSTQSVNALLRSSGYSDAQVQSFNPNGNAGSKSTRGVSIRIRELKQSSPEKRKLESLMQRRFGKFEELGFQDVGPSVGADIRDRSVIAIGIAAIGILAYISFAFRKVNHPWRYGLCAIIAMLHDVLVVIGIFSILGHFFGTKVDSLFVTALLTVIGFSVHDTIVVFDRIRENQLRRYGERFDRIVNFSLIQTLVRSVNTSLTVLVTLAALYFFGGATIRDFVLALLIGIFSGTYSSIFNASMLLVVWENREFGRLFGRGDTAAAT